MLSDEQRKRSNYIEIINKYRNFFQDEDIYILFYDSILNEPEALIEKYFNSFWIKIIFKIAILEMLITVQKN